jgi:hypothetical protein
VRSSYVDTDTFREPNDDSDARLGAGNPELDKSLAQLEKRMREYEREHAKEDRAYSRRFMRRQTIELVEAASQIPHCTWGIYHSKGWGLLSLGSLNQLALLLDYDAQALAGDGDYRTALERCLTMRRFAHHLGCETINNYLASLSIDAQAFKRAKHILGSMPPDAETLTWFRGQLARSQGAPRSFVPALETSFERALSGLSHSPKTVARVRNRFMDEGIAAEDKDAVEKLKGLPDEDLILLIREAASAALTQFLDSARRVIESNKPYDQTYMEIELLTYKLRVHDFIVPFYDLTSVMITPDFYRIDTNRKTRMNAVKAGIEIYLIAAKTGELPDVLPDGLAKDPFTGRDFVYEMTDEGFALRCQGKEFQKGRMRQALEFKVQE